MGAQKNHLIETVLLSTHSICFGWGIRKLIFWYTRLTKVMIERKANIRNQWNNSIWAATRDFQKCGILTSVDSDEPVQPSVKLRNSKWYSVSSLTVIEYSIDYLRLWSDCTYAHAGLSLSWWHIPHCWKSHVVAHLYIWC